MVRKKAEFDFNFILPHVNPSMWFDYVRHDEFPEERSMEFIIVKREHYLYYSFNSSEYYSFELYERSDKAAMRNMPKDAKCYYFVDKVEVLNMDWKAVFYDNPSYVHYITSRLPFLKKAFKDAYDEAWVGLKKQPILPEDMKFGESGTIIHLGAINLYPFECPFYLKSFDDIFGVFDSRDGKIVFRNNNENFVQKRADELNRKIGIVL